MGADGWPGGRGRAQCGGGHTSSSSPSLPSPSPSLLWPSPSLASPSLPSPSLPSSSPGGGAAPFVGSRAQAADRIVAASSELCKERGGAGSERGGVRGGARVRRGATHQAAGSTAGTAGRAGGEAGRGAGSIGSRLNCGAANAASCGAGSERGTTSSSATGGGEEHSRGRDLLRRGGGGRAWFGGRAGGVVWGGGCGGVEQVRRGLEWQGEVSCGASGEVRRGHLPGRGGGSGGVCEGWGAQCGAAVRIARLSLAGPLLQARGAPLLPRGRAGLLARLVLLLNHGELAAAAGTHSPPLLAKLPVLLARATAGHATPGRPPPRVSVGMMSGVLRGGTSWLHLLPGAPWPSGSARGEGICDASAVGVLLVADMMKKAPSQTMSLTRPVTTHMWCRNRYRIRNGCRIGREGKTGHRKYFAFDQLVLLGLCSTRQSSIYHATSICHFFADT